MNNSEKFKEVFGYFATEMWAKSETEFLEWINKEYQCTVEPKKGKWVWVDGIRCSKCNHKLQTTGLPSVCPNCGADMKGE